MKDSDSISCQRSASFIKLKKSNELDVETSDPICWPELMSTDNLRFQELAKPGLVKKDSILQNLEVPNFYFDDINRSVSCWQCCAEAINKLFR